MQCCLKSRLLCNKCGNHLSSARGAGGGGVSVPAELVYIKLSKPPVPLSTYCMWLLGGYIGDKLGY